MKTKICTKCKVEKSLDEFAKDNRRLSGYGSWCRLCKNEDSKKFRKNNPDGKIQTKKHNIKSKYGITLEQWQQMYDEQGGYCAICRQPEVNRNLGVDHQHSDGKVRSLLCCKCNLLVGIIETEFWGLKDKVITYLEKHNG